jgi:hypothetical protein
LLFDVKDALLTAPPQLKPIKIVRFASFRREIVFCTIRMDLSMDSLTTTAANIRTQTNATMTKRNRIKMVVAVVPVFTKDDAERNRIPTNIAAMMMKEERQHQIPGKGGMGRCFGLTTSISMLRLPLTLLLCRIERNDRFK